MRDMLAAARGGGRRGGSRAGVRGVTRCAAVRVGGAGGDVSLEGLRRADEALKGVRRGAGGGERKAFVKRHAGACPGDAQVTAFDAVVCGGTLGVFHACALQKLGRRVALVERGAVQGRDQEWNIAREELKPLVELGVLTEEELDDAISMEFNPVRIAFHGGYSGTVRDVLNLGVSPAKVVASARRRFEQLGGTVLEGAAIEGIDVFDDGAVVRRGGGGAVRGRLVLDCMGNASPCVAQARHGVPPDAVCLVVGTCADGYDPKRNTTGDLLVTDAPIAPGDDHQFFWEAFPAGGSDHPTRRTTYMFTYLDADPRRELTLSSMLEEYYKRLPAYQGIESTDELTVVRTMFAFFPAWRDSPLPPIADRVLQVGDASGVQSPLSFGGFGALCRHLRRLRDACDDALACDALLAEDLAEINAYLPGLSAQWAFYSAMKMAPGAGGRASEEERDFVNAMMSGNFDAMESLGDAVMRPFLRDVPQFGGLGRTLLAYAAAKPLMVPSLVRAVGVGNLAQWVGHYLQMGWYTLLYDALGAGVRSGSARSADRAGFRARRMVDAWRFGSGRDLD